MHYTNHWTNRYFWRTHTQQEIDYIEEREGMLYAYEFKWRVTKKIRFPKSFIHAYPEHRSRVISTDNYMEFLTEL